MFCSTAAGAGGAATAATLVPVEVEEENPHPVLPFCNWAPGPEHIPVGFAQQPEPQSALLRHWPPMNWPPAPLPTFFVPEGSNGGTARTAVARTTRAAMENFIMQCVKGLEIYMGMKLKSKVK